MHSAASAEWHFPLLVAHGVTGVRNLHTTVDTALELTNAIGVRLSSGELLGPRFVANGPIVDGVPPAWDGAVSARTAERGRAVVDSLAERGAAFIKVYDNLEPDVFHAVADRARWRGLPVIGHVPFAVRPEDAAAAGMRTIEHLSGIESGCSNRSDSVRTARRKAVALPFPDVLVEMFRLERALYDTRKPARCAATVQAYLRSGTIVVPTLVIQRNSNWPDSVLLDAATVRFVPAPALRRWRERAGPGPGDTIRGLMRDTWARRLENVRLLYEAGVPIGAGTDVGNPFLVPGISLHQELALLVDAGLSPLAALQAATINAAHAIGAADSIGTVDVGRLADLVLLDADPLDDIANARRIRAVVLRGRYLDRAALDALLQTRSAR